MIMPQDEKSGRWTVAELLRWTEGYFQRHGLSTPRLDAEVLLSKALGKPRIELYTGYQMLVEPKERTLFRSFVERRARREPVAYITGKREFYSLPFEVNSAVLVPRPETEHLVEVALSELEAARGAVDASVVLRVLDIGTGSGNIAVAIAASSHGVTVDAVDISEEALAVARRNAEANTVADRIGFFQGDLFLALPSSERRYRVIVSNPPYISAAAYEGLMEDVRLHEPRQALFDAKSPGADGLGFYRAIAGAAAPFLEPDALLAVEVGAGQAAEVRAILTGEGWRVEQVVGDYGGIERVVCARR